MTQHALHRHRSRPRGISGTLVFGAIAIVVFAVLGLVFAQARNGDGVRTQTSGDMYVVRRGSFDVTVPASGELVAAQQVEIRNRLELRAVITEIVSEGKTVRKGDLLMRLNDEDIRNRIKDAEDVLNTAESNVVSAQANLAIRQSAAESEYDRAELRVELAKLALEAWEKGEVESRRKQLETALETSQINFERLEDRYAKSQELFAEDFISADELQRDRIAMIEAQARFEQAKLDRNVYWDYTFLQQQKQRRSDLQQAIAELDRVQQRFEAELRTARSDLATRQHQLLSRQERLADLEQQLEHCRVYAPTDGLVVYVTSLETGGGRRGMSSGGDPPQVGTELSRNELVMVLPDTTRMIAAVKVNESLSGLISPGQRARIVSDAVRDVVLTGEVLSVGVLAESGGWRDPNRRDYTVRIAIDGGNEHGLRPSMRARTEIFVDQVEDAVHVPVQAIFRAGRSAYVYVPAGRRGYRAHPVTVGRASELYVEILDGLEPGDNVLLRRPNPGELVGEAPGNGAEAAEAGVQMEQQEEAQPQPRRQPPARTPDDTAEQPQDDDALEAAPRERPQRGQGGPGSSGRPRPSGD